MQEIKVEDNELVLDISYYLKVNRLKPLKYAAVLEFQERGAVHYHLLCGLPYIPNEILANIWGNGFVGINKLDNVDNVGAYVVKYMQEDLSDERLNGNKCYFTSRNLKKPIEITDRSLIYIILKKIKAKREYSATYYSGYCGEISYKQTVIEERKGFREYLIALIRPGNGKLILTEA